MLGATLPNDDGTFSVYINARLGDAARRETLCHELEHMARDHFYQSAPIAAQEAEARGETAPTAPPETRLFLSAISHSRFSSVPTGISILAPSGRSANVAICYPPYPIRTLRR